MAPLHPSGLITHADSLISLAGIKSAVGASGPLKETNKSRQVLERDPRKSGLDCEFGQDK